MHATATAVGQATLRATKNEKIPSGDFANLTHSSKKGRDCRSAALRLSFLSDRETENNNRDQ